MCTHTHAHNRSQPLGNEGGEEQHIIHVKSGRFMTHMEFSVRVKGVNISLYPDLVCYYPAAGSSKTEQRSTIL